MCIRDRYGGLQGPWLHPDLRTLFYQQSDFTLLTDMETADGRLVYFVAKVDAGALAKCPPAGTNVFVNIIPNLAVAMCYFVLNDNETKPFYFEHMIMLDTERQRELLQSYFAQEASPFFLCGQDGSSLGVTALGMGKRKGPMERMLGSLPPTIERSSECEAVAQRGRRSEEYDQHFSLNAEFSWHHTQKCSECDIGWYSLPFYAHNLKTNEPFPDHLRVQYQSVKIVDVARQASITFDVLPVGSCPSCRKLLCERCANNDGGGIPCCPTCHDPLSVTDNVASILTHVAYGAWIYDPELECRMGRIGIKFHGE